MHHLKAIVLVLGPHYVKHRTAHTMAFGTHVLVHWLELEIAEWVFIVRKKPSGSVK